MGPSAWLEAERGVGALLAGEARVGADGEGEGEGHLGRYEGEGVRVRGYEGVRGRARGRGGVPRRRMECVEEPEGAIGAGVGARGTLAQSTPRASGEGEG